MKYNFTVKNINVKSNWFDFNTDKKTVYDKIGYEGIYLYFTLYKFRVFGQDNDHTFYTSIDTIRKAIREDLSTAKGKKYTGEFILELLKKMSLAKIIKIRNISRWDYMFENDKLKEDKFLEIEAINTFAIGKKIDTKEKEDNYFIPINFELFQLYHDKGLKDDKYYSLFCLISRLSNGNKSDSITGSMGVNPFYGHCYMTIIKMSDILNIDKNTINRMIWSMNRAYVLCSYKKKNVNGHENYQHYILKKGDNNTINQYNKIFKEDIDSIIKKLDKANKRKGKHKRKKAKTKKSNNKSIPITSNTDKEIKILFNNKIYPSKDKVKTPF